MAILGKKDIARYLSEGKLVFDPAIDKFQLQPNSLDLRVGWSFYIPEQWKYSDEGRSAVEPNYLEHKANQDYFRFIKLRPGQYFEFLPHEFAIISSLEKVSLKDDNLMALLYPRSSVARRGFVIESGVVDVHYEGHMMIPVLNGTSHTLRLYPGERIYQLVFHTLEQGLSSEEAQMHGVQKAKYHGATAQNLEARTDSEDELKFIKEGKIAELKERYKA
ncbi:MAG: dCTP deaminase [Patescibacteria group bacterium]